MWKLVKLLLLLIFFSINVSAQETNEGRIAEHEIVSAVAFVGIAGTAYFVRKKRKNDVNK